MDRTSFVEEEDFLLSVGRVTGSRTVLTILVLLYQRCPIFEQFA